MNRSDSLRDSDHPYYCAESNFYKARDADQTYESWADFVEYGDCLFDGDRDMNMLFRWDWNTPDLADYDINEPVPADELELFFMLQRKGIFLPVTIENITRDDEPAVRAWLEERWETMKAMWEPLS